MIFFRNQKTLFETGEHRSIKDIYKIRAAMEEKTTKYYFLIIFERSRILILLLAWSYTH